MVPVPLACGLRFTPNSNQLLTKQTSQEGRGSKHTVRMFLVLCHWLSTFSIKEAFKEDTCEKA